MGQCKEIRRCKKLLTLSSKALEEKPQAAEGEEEERSERRPSNNRRRNNNRDNRTASERSTANAPEEQSGFTLGDLIGNELKNAENNNDEN